MSEAWAGSGKGSPAPVPAPVVLLNQLGAATGRALVTRQAHVLRVIDDEAPAWDRAHEAEVLLTAPRHGWGHAPAEAPPGWPGRLRWVHTASVGIDFFPDWLFEVPQVTCARGVAAVPIAEFVLAALLEHDRSLAQRRVAGPVAWRREFERASASPMPVLQGQTLGLVGFGAIGREVAQRALAFGMGVMALRRTSAPVGLPGVRAVASLHELMACSDHVVLAAPITPETRHLINAEALSHARPGQHLVNIARGQLVDHEALLRALDAGPLAAATLDVTDPEPLPEGHALYLHPRVRLTPHISWAAGDVEVATLRKFQDNLDRYLAGLPLHDRVDPGRGY